MKNEYSYDNFQSKYSANKDLFQEQYQCGGLKAEHPKSENEIQKRGAMLRTTEVTKLCMLSRDKTDRAISNWKSITSSTFYGDSGPLLSKLYTVPEELMRYFEIYDGTEGVLGRGAYSSVFKIRSRRSGNIYALKVMSIEHFTCRGLANQLRREIQLQSQCYHPNIVQIYKCIEHCGYVFLILEYVDTNLFNILHGKKKNQVIKASSRRNRYIPNEELINEVTDETLFSRNEVISYISQLLKAVNYLHEMSIVHRDIKPENILISYEGRVKLGDFGWCGDLCRRCSSMAGTFCYMAPEILKGQKQSAKVDSWSVGILLYELYVGNVPFVPVSCNESKGNSSQVISMLNSIREISKEIKPKKFPMDAWNLCCWLLRCNPNERASPLQALNHPFLSEKDTIPQNLFNQKSETIYSTPKVRRETIPTVFNSTFTALPLVALPTPTSRTKQRKYEVKRMSTEVPSSLIINDYVNKSNHIQHQSKQYNSQIYKVRSEYPDISRQTQEDYSDNIQRILQHPKNLNVKNYENDPQMLFRKTYGQDQFDKITRGANFYNKFSLPQVNPMQGYKHIATAGQNAVNRYVSQPPVHYYQKIPDNNHKNHYLSRDAFKYKY